MFHSHVVSIVFRFMLIQPTPLDGETNEKVEGPIIINLESFLQVSFESNFEQIFASSTGHFLICIRGPEVTTCKLEKSGIQPAGKSFSLPVLKTVANVIVTTCDSKIVCLTDKGELWYQNMITGNLIQLSVDEGESTEIIGDLANVKLIVSPEYLLVHRGLRKRTEANLYGINLMAPEEPLKCFKESPFPLHLTIMHKTGRWIAAATEIDYVFTVTTVNSNHCRLYVFDVESTTPVFRVKGTKGAFSCIQFLGDQHQYLGFSRKYDPMLVIVGLGTPDEPNHTATQLLRVSGGHAKAIYGVLYDNTESLLVTCSSDNTIKTWDLVAVLNVCELACKNTDMQKPVDKRSKLGQEEFLSQKQETLLKAGLDLAKLEHLQFASNLADELDRKDLAGCHAKVIAVAKSGSYAVCGCVFGR